MRERGEIRKGGKEVRKEGGERRKDWESERKREGEGGGKDSQRRREEGRRGKGRESKGLGSDLYFDRKHETNFDDNNGCNNCNGSYKHRLHSFP